MVVLRTLVGLWTTDRSLYDVVSPTYLQLVSHGEKTDDLTLHTFIILLFIIHNFCHFHRDAVQPEKGQCSCIQKRLCAEGLSPY